MSHRVGLSVSDCNSSHLNIPNQTQQKPEYIHRKMWIFFFMSTNKTNHFRVIPIWISQIVILNTCVGVCFFDWMEYDLKHKNLILMLANWSFSSLSKTNKPSVTFQHISIHWWQWHDYSLTKLLPFYTLLITWCGQTYLKVGTVALYHM